MERKKLTQGKEEFEWRDLLENKSEEKEISKFQREIV